MDRRSTAARERRSKVAGLNSSADGGRMRAASVEESALRSSDSSEEVRAFYERHPYPPPLGNLDRHRELYRDPGRRQALTLLLWPTRRPTPDRKILIAGCWHIAGRHSCNARAGRAGDGDRHQRVQPQPHARSSEKYSIRNLDLRRFAIEDVGRAWPDLRRDRLHRRAPPPARPGPWPAVIARCFDAGWGATRHGLCGVRPCGRLHDAGILPTDRRPRRRT